MPSDTPAPDRGQRCRCKGCQGPGKCWCCDQEPMALPDDMADAPTPAPDVCRDCERCAWDPESDCGIAEHSHCPTCGHCMGRHGDWVKWPDTTPAPDRLAEIAEKHVSFVTPRGYERCAECLAHWPCEVGVVLAALRAAEAGRKDILWAGYYLFATLVNVAEALAHCTDPAVDARAVALAQRHNICALTTEDNGQRALALLEADRAALGAGADAAGAQSDG